MFNYFNKQNFSSKLFVIASLSAFSILAVFYLLFSFSANYQTNPTHSSTDRYFINKNFDEGDPFITREPTLKDIISGPIITAADPMLGDDTAPVVIIEFADYQCEFCRKQEEVIKKILANYKGKVSYLWKDFPENNPDSISFKAAVSARCAGEQAKFWPYHELLFKESKNLNEELFLKLADKLKLDKKKFAQCQSGVLAKQLINDNMEEANALDITGIPFLYVNDRELMGETTYDELEKIIKIELEAKK